MSVILTSGATTVTLPDPVNPEKEPLSPRQVRGVSGGGAVKVATMGAEDQVFDLRFRRVQQAVKEDLETFLATTVNWSGTAFDYVDWNSVTTEDVRYWGGWEEWERGKGGLWSGRLMLRKDLGA